MRLSCIFIYIHVGIAERFPPEIELKWHNYLKPFQCNITIYSQGRPHYDALHYLLFNNFYLKYAMWCISPYNAEILFHKPWRTKSFFKFEIIINVLVSSFRFIWIPMLWVYGHYIFLFLPVRGPTLDVKIWRLCQIQKCKVGPRAERVNATRVSKGLTLHHRSRLYI